MYLYIRSCENHTKNTRKLLKALKSQRFFHLENIRTFIRKIRISYFLIETGETGRRDDRDRVLDLSDVTELEDV